MMREKYQVMDPLDSASYAKLKGDIRENGLAIPIDVDEFGNILDGYNRKKICDELGIPCEKTVHPGMTEEEKLDFALRVNINRRHLTKEQITEIIIQFKKAHPEMSNRAVAEVIGASKSTVDRKLSEDDLNSDEWLTVPMGQLARTKGKDGKVRPANGEKAKQQREAIRNAIEDSPDKSDRQIARETGASHVTVAAQRKKMRSFHNPSARDTEALKDPDIVRRLEENENLNVAGAIREQKRDQIIEHLEDVEVKEAKATEGVYDVIVIDPPWPMQKIERDARPCQSEFDYPTMSIDEIKDLAIPAADDCHVFLWTTQKFLPDAFDVLKAWGMKYVCTFVWHKNSGYKPFGLPTYNCEFALYAHKGSPKFIDEKRFWTCFSADATGHSKKPEEFYDTIRRVTAGRRLDMFNRRDIEGFDGWGKEASE